MLTRLADLVEDISRSANLEVLLHQEVVHGLFFDLTVDDFLLEDFDFCLGVNQLLLLLLVGGVELAQSVGFGLKGLFKLADADLVGHRAFVAHAHRPEPMLTCSTVLHPMKTTPQVRRLRRMERGAFVHRDERGTNGVTCYLWWARPTSIMDQEVVCDPAYGRMDDLLDVLTVPKPCTSCSCWTNKAAPCASPTSSGWWTALNHGLASPEGAQRARTHSPNGRAGGSGSYALSDDAKSLSPIFTTCSTGSRACSLKPVHDGHSFAAMGGSVIECPASPMMCSGCAARRCADPRASAGHTTS